MTEEEKINYVVDGLVIELNHLCDELGCEYGEDLHNAILQKFDDIFETEYRKWLGKIH